jgi:FkbH-like protein
MDRPRQWPASIAERVAVAVESGSAGAIRDVLRAIRALPREERGRPFRLGICRTFTIETQLDALTLGLATLPCDPEFIVGDLGNIEQLLLDPRSAMLQGALDAVLVLWRLEELHSRLAFEHDGMDTEERERATAYIISRIEKLCADYVEVSPVPLFLSTLPEHIALCAAMRDVHSQGGPRRAVLSINRTLFDLATRYSQVHLFDFSGWAARAGVGAFDSKMDLYARQPVSRRSLMSFAAALADCFRALLLSPAKVLALDLDNVLWGGVLGEDGIDGLKIGHDFPGNVYRHVQLQVLALKNRGVLLVLLSKNNLADVEQAFLTLPDMPIKLENFAALRVNWREKCENLRDVARELNLGLDSFVFVDDQGFEREQMRFHLPEVRVLEASEDPLRTLQVLTDCREFDVYRVTNEDHRRSSDYVAQARRHKFEASSQDPKDFLFTLQLQARIVPVEEATIQRAVQMLGKTNQFNVTTRRHAEAHVRRMQGNEANLLLMLSLSDTFGDQGIVGLAIALGDPESRVLKVDSFLLSCRAIGRGAEQALWAELLARASSMGYTVLQAEYVRTGKNQQVADLFERFGMARQEGSTEERSTFILDLPTSVASPAWINVITTG